MNEKGLEIQKKMCIKMLSVPVEFWLHLAQWSKNLYGGALLKLRNFDFDLTLNKLNEKIFLENAGTYSKVHIF